MADDANAFDTFFISGIPKDKPGQKRIVNRGRGNGIGPKKETKEMGIHVDMAGLGPPGFGGQSNSSGVDGQPNLSGEYGQPRQGWQPPPQQKQEQPLQQQQSGLGGRRRRGHF